MIYEWNPWDDRRILADEAEWQKPHMLNGVCAEMDCRKTLIVGPDVFDHWNGVIRRASKILNTNWEPATNSDIHNDELLNLCSIVKRLFLIIDDCQNLDFVLTTSEPGRVRTKSEWPPVANQANPTYRQNVIISVPIRTQADADRLVPELLKLRDLCGGLGVMAEPVEKIDLSKLWVPYGDPWDYDHEFHRLDVLTGFKAHKGGGHTDERRKISHLLITGGIPEHCDSLAAQCESAGCKVLRKQ